MTTWTSDELQKIATAEELEVASLRGDGTLRKPTPIWVVRIVVVYRSNAVRNPLDGCYSETC